MELMHYGVRGMHWGVINEEESVPETKSSAIERFRNFEKNFSKTDFSKSGLDSSINNYVKENPIDQDYNDTAKQFAKESRDMAVNSIKMSYVEATVKKQILDKLKETRSEEEIAKVYDKINDAVSRRSRIVNDSIPIFDNRTFAAQYGDEFNEGEAINKIETFSATRTQIAEEAQRYLEENFEELRGTDWELSVDEAVAINDPSSNKEQMSNEMTQEKTTVSKEEIKDEIPTSNRVVMDTPISEIKVTKESIKQKISKFIGKAVESAKKAIENGVNFIKKLFGRG